MKPIAAPQQARSRRTLALVLDAAEHLLERSYFDDISIGEIAEQAGVSVGNVYARFGSKETLLLVLHERYKNDRTRHMRAALADPTLAAAPLRQRIDGIAQAVVDLFRARRGVLRSLILRHWRNPAGVDAGSRRDLDELLDQMTGLLLGARGGITHADAEPAVRFGLAALLAMAREAIVLRPHQLPGAPRMTDAALAAQLAHMLHAYLTLPPLQEIRHE